MSEQMPRYVWSTARNATLIHVCQGENHNGNALVGSSRTNLCWNIAITHWSGCDLPWETPTHLGRCVNCFNAEHRQAWDTACLEQLAEGGVPA